MCIRDRGDHLVAKRTIQTDVAQQIAHLVQFVLTEVTDVLPLETQLALKDLILSLGSHVLPGDHGNCSGNCSGASGEEHVPRGHTAANHSGDKKEHRHEPIVDTQNHVPQVRAVPTEVFGERRAAFIGRLDSHEPESVSYTHLTLPTLL